MAALLQMPMHQQAKAVLEFMAQHSIPSPGEVSMAELRAAILQTSKPRRAPDLASVKDVHCAGPTGPMRIRIYNPEANPTAQQPALIYIHGGGWCWDSVESHDAVCRGLALQANLVVLSLDYRLAAEHPFPAAVEDCYAATEWIYKHAADLNIDPARLAIGGDSAGGNLSLTTILQAQKHQSHVRFACQLLIYPCVDLNAETESRKVFAEGCGIDPAAWEFVFASYARDHDMHDPLLSPYFAPDLNFMPPTLIVTAENDPVRDEGKLFADRLLDQGVACKYECCEGMVHGFMIHMYVLPLDAAEAATTACAKYLAENLR